MREFTFLIYESYFLFTISLYNRNKDVLKGALEMVWMSIIGILEDKLSLKFIALTSSTLFLSLLPYLIGMYVNLKRRRVS